MVVRTDQQLFAAVAEGDRGALRELHDRHAAWVTARLRRRCSDPDAVAEAVQDTFVAVWRGAGRWDGSGEPAAWICGIAIRRLISVLRVHSRWARI
ncbi:MAG TPA: sigma factor, partial [Acidimicrobiales bacterium]|nr:sigma factor [Acidimicrobiales bacterium]